MAKIENSVLCIIYHNKEMKEISYSSINIKQNRI